MQSESEVAQSCPTLCHPVVAYQAPLSIGFSRQEYWSGLPFPSPENLPNPGIKPGSPALQADSLPAELQGKPTGFGDEQTWGKVRVRLIPQTTAHNRTGVCSSRNK